MPLDELYGVCSPAGSVIEPHELRLSPLSLTELTTATSSAVASYLTATPAINLTSIFAQTYHVLRLIDEDGRVHIAIEEIIDGNDERVGALPLSRHARPPNVKKLGHPSLLYGHSLNARIGGEIIFDPAWGAGPDWVLTDKSGRYGLR
jgi:hypothetical protein